MAYSITFGELGYNVLHDGKIIRINVPTRALAQTEIEDEIKHQNLLKSAQERVHNLFVGLREDFGLSQYEVESILEAEGFKLDPEF